MRRIALACAAAVLLLPPVAAQRLQPHSARKLAVVAVRDGAWLTVCPVFGKQVVHSAIWDSRMSAPVTVTEISPGLQALSFHSGDGTSGRAVLPIASTIGIYEGPPLTDPAGRADIETALRAKGYTVVDAPDAADFVLMVESYYRMSPPQQTVISGRDLPKPGAQVLIPGTRDELPRREAASVPPGQADSSVRDRTPGSDVRAFLRSGRRGNWRASAIAVLVPASVYRERPLDAPAIVEASAWEGIALAEYRRKGDRMSIEPASMPALVDQLGGKGRKYPADLPVCAVTAPPMVD